MVKKFSPLTAMVVHLFKGIRFCLRKCDAFYSSYLSRLIFCLNGAAYADITSNGLPYVSISKNGRIFIGSGLQLNNGIKYCESGLMGKCRFEVHNGASLTIGDQVGLSSVTITCSTQITIGSNAQIGVGVHIYDTDFHSLDSLDRLDPTLDAANQKRKPVHIGSNVLIGAHSIILKGVDIGDNAVIGAGSVVTKSVPANERWAGNPAKKIA